MEEERKAYRCNPNRIAAILVIWGALAIVAFYIVTSIARHHFNLSQSFAYIQGGFWICLMIYAVIGAKRVISVARRQLKIAPTEITYVYGVLADQKIAVPISNVLACGWRKNFTQRISRTSDLIVFTIGGMGVLYLSDIEEGEEAYNRLMSMISVK